MKKIFALICVLLVLVSCGRRKSALLPNVSGKAGEVIVVIDKDNWEGAAGNSVRELLACECPFLPQVEPLYTLRNIAPGAFGQLFKVHRNIVVCGIGQDYKEAAVNLFRDVWAAPQCVVRLQAPDAESFCSLLSREGKTVVSAIEQAERDRVIANSKLYEERSLAPIVSEVFGGSPHFPSGYKLKKCTDSFIWIADEKQYTTQGVLVYKYPSTGKDSDFAVENIIAHRNAILKENIPGMFENTWMTTSSFWAPTTEHIRYSGRVFTQTRGLWEVQNDYMGGPFVSHSFYSPDGKDIIVAEAFVYAPRYDKRQYLRQVESILYSWEWKE